SARPAPSLPISSGHTPASTSSASWVLLPGARRGAPASRGARRPTTRRRWRTPAAHPAPPPPPWRGTPRRSGRARPAGKDREGSRRSASPLPFREPRPADTRDGTQAFEAMAQDALPRRRQPVRSPPVLRRQRLDPAARLEPRDRAVERARPRPLPRHRLDVLRHRVAVLRAVGERDQDVEGRLGETSQARQQVVAFPQCHVVSQVAPPGAGRCYAGQSITLRVVESRCPNVLRATPAGVSPGETPGTLPR